MKKRGALRAAGAGLAACAMSGIGLFIGCMGCQERTPPAKPPIPVKTWTVEPSAAHARARYSATVRPNAQVDLAFKVGGYVEQILQIRGSDDRLRDVQEGDRVVKGTILARLRESDYLVKRNQVKAQLAEVEAATTTALRNRPDIKAARLRIEQAEHDPGAKKAEYIPDVSLAFHYVNLGDLNSVPTQIAMVGFHVTWEPFDWGRKSREMADKRRGVQRAELGAQESEAKTVVEVNARFRKLQERYTLLHVTSLTQDAAREKLRVTMNRYNQQAALIQEALQAQATLADANGQAYQALPSFWTANAGLEQVMGEDPS
ncbi:MAG: TolC family protein [Nitrospiraceae bacterium]